MYRQFLAVLALATFLCPALNATEAQELSRALQQAAAQAAISNEGVMNENMLMTVSFTERGSLQLDDDFIPEDEPLTGPDWQVPPMFSQYEHESFFIYKALPSERNNNNAFVDEGEYYLYTDKPLKGRTPIQAKARFTGRLQSGRYSGTIGCKVYALGPQWLITSATCPINRYDPSPLDIQGTRYTERTDRQIKRISVEGKTIQNPKYFINDHILLVYIPQKGNASLISNLAHKKKLHILAFNRPQNIFALNAFGQFFVHTSRFGLLVEDKTSAKLEGGSLNGTRFKASSSFSGTATDPLFFQNKNKQEYLTAFNSAEEHYVLDISIDDLLLSSWSGDSSDTYYMLNGNDLKFIQKTVKSLDPQGWNTIRPSLFMNIPGHQYFKVVNK